MKKTLRTISAEDYPERKKMSRGDLILKDELPYTKIREVYSICGEEFYVYIQNNLKNGPGFWVPWLSQILDVSEEELTKSIMKEENAEFIDDFLKASPLLRAEVYSRQVVKEQV